MDDPQNDTLRLFTPSAAASGFTLVELLVVIAIVVVLLSLLAPALDRAISEAEAAVCGANVHNLGQALHQYAQASRWYLPDAMIFGIWRPNDNRGQKYNPHSWHVDRNGRIGAERVADDPATYPGGLLWPYVRTEKVFLCPTFSGLTNESHYVDSDPLGYSHTSVERRIGLAYVMHRSIGGVMAQGMTLTRLTGLWQEAGGGTRPVNPSAQLIFAEEGLEGNAFARIPRNDSAIDVNRDPTNPGLWDGLGDFHPSGARGGRPGEGTVNVGFLDGHVERGHPSRSQSLAWPGLLRSP
jgi:prepilin-type N-terminal cleavage/methylation domain-containing protein/prepilin-type processing-associated H-X9-DG protein